MDLSVMMCTWNNSQRLARTLASITACAVPPGVQWELVLVNNHCTDETDRVAHHFRQRLPLVYLSEPVLGLTRARNAGLAAVRGRLLVFTDDDVTPCQGWLSAYWSAYQERPVGYFFGGPIESEFEGGRPDARLLHLAPCSVKGFDDGTVAKLINRRTCFIASNWACPVAVLRQIGGFDVRRGLNAVSDRVCVGSETHLIRRLRRQGWRGWYLPEARLTHFVPLNKSTLHHIAVRGEAGTFERAMACSWSEHPWCAWVLFGGACLWAAGWWILRRLRRARGEDAWAYVKWRQAVGWVAGFAETFGWHHGMRCERPVKLRR